MGSIFHAVSIGVDGNDNVRDVIGSVAASIAVDRGGVGPVLQSVVASANSTLTQAEQAGKGGSFNPGVGQQLLKSFQTDLTRLAYVAALEKSLKKTTGPGPFNIDTAINDLWLALDGIKRGQQPLTSSQVQSAKDLTQSMSTMMQKMSQSAAGVIQNIK